MKSLIRNIKNKYDYISVQTQINDETSTRFAENKLKINPSVVILTGWQEASSLPAQSRDSDGKMWYIVRVRSVDDESDSSRLDPFENGLTEEEIYDRIQSHRQAHIPVEAVPTDGGKICAFNRWRCSYTSQKNGVGKGPIILENWIGLPNSNRIIKINKGRQWNSNGAKPLGSMATNSGAGDAQDQYIGAILPIDMSVSRVSSRMGLRTHPKTGEKSTGHGGVDFAAPLGTQMYAIYDGVVIQSRGTTIDGSAVGGFGAWVVVEHKNVVRNDGEKKTLYAVYGHVNGSYVKTGDKVTQGQVITMVGNEGTSTGPHLHFELSTGWGTGKRRKDTKLDPIYALGWNI